MMMLRRNIVKVKLDVLGSLISHGSLNPTNICCFANINSNKLKKIIENLKHDGLIINKTVNKTNSLYSITSKGLTTYRKGFSSLI